MAANAKRRENAIKAERQLKPRKAVLREDIRIAVWHGERHSRYLCGVLDGLEGKVLRYWAERELKRQENELANLLVASERLRQRTVERSAKLSVDLVNLRETRRNIKGLENESIVLTEDKKLQLCDLDDRENALAHELEEWRDDLLRELHYFADLILETIENDRTGYWPSVDFLATDLLLDRWDRSDEIEYRDQLS